MSYNTHDLVELLTLQGHVSNMTRAARRIGEIKAELAELAKQTSPSSRLRLDLQTEKERVERELSLVRKETEVALARKKRDEKLVDTSTDHKQIAGLHQELDRLALRLDEFETKELELLEGQASVDEKMAALQTEISAHDDEIARQRAQLNSEGAELSKVGAEAKASADALSAELPADLVESFTAARATNGLVGAQRIAGGVCPSTGLPLDNGDRKLLAEASEAELFYCPQCGAIVVKASA